MAREVYASDNGQLVDANGAKIDLSGLIASVISTFTQTYSTANATIAAPTTAAMTDNSTGAVGVTFAAGVGVYDLVLPAPANLSTLSTGGVDVVTGLVIGHKFKLLSWEFITTLAGTNAGASLVFNMEIGTTNVTGGVLTVDLAGTSDIGERTAATAITAANTGTASDALSVEVAAGGTAFTAGSGYFVIKVQNMDTADAVASLVDQLTKVTADDLDLRQGLTSVIDVLQAAELAG